MSANNKEFPVHIPISLMVSPGSKGGSSISANLLASLRTYTKDTSTNKNSLCFHKPSSLHLQVNSIKDNKYSKILKYCLGSSQRSTPGSVLWQHTSQVSFQAPIFCCPGHLHKSNSLTVMDRAKGISSFPS